MHNQGGSPPKQPPGTAIAVAITIAVALVASACSSGPSPSADPSPTSANPGATQRDTPAIEQDAVAAEATSASAAPASGELSIRLTQGASAGDPVAEPIEIVTGEPLGLDDIAAIFDRLPPLVAESSDLQDFSRPPESLPPPLSGETVSQVFPSSV